MKVQIKLLDDGQNIFLCIEKMTPWMDGSCEDFDDKNNAAWHIEKQAEFSRTK